MRGKIQKYFIYLYQVSTCAKATHTLPPLSLLKHTRHDHIHNFLKIIMIHTQQTYIFSSIIQFSKVQYAVHCLFTFSIHNEILLFSVSHSWSLQFIYALSLLRKLGWNRSWMSCWAFHYAFWMYRFSKKNRWVGGSGDGAWASTEFISLNLMETKLLTMKWNSVEI